MIGIHNSKGETIAILSADVSIYEIVSTLVKYTTTILIGCIIISICFLCFLYRWMKRRVITPIQQMEESARLFVNDTHREMGPDALQFKKPDINTGDEMQMLSNALVNMSDDVKKYLLHIMNQTREKERISSELNVATKIQADMLPKKFPPFPQYNQFDIYASMTPAKEVGGDFYDFFLVDDNHIALVIADVSGKGVPAALFMVIAKTLIKTHTQYGGTPSQILADVNSQLCENNESKMFVTIWMAIIKISTGKGIAVNAGHEHPILKRKDGEFELVKYRHSPALGLVNNIPVFEHEFKLNEGDTLFVYTDGIPEATNKNEQFFETSRMLDSLNNSKCQDLKEIFASLRADLKSFVDDAPQFDDMPTKETQVMWKYNLIMLMILSAFASLMRV